MKKKYENYSLISQVTNLSIGYVTHSDLQIKNIKFSNIQI